MPVAILTERPMFRAHFEKLPGPAYIWERDGEDFRIIAHNAAGAHFGDKRAPLIIGMTAHEMGAFDPTFPEFLHRAAARGEILEKENDVRFDGSLTLRIVATFVPLPPDIVVVHARDVTDQRELEERLRSSEARLRALIEAIPDTILRMDADARIIEIHYPRSLEPLPWKPEELIGRSVADFYGPRAQEQQAHYNREAIRTGETQIFEIRIPGPDRVMHLESRVVRIDDHEVVVTSRDVSERAELEGQQTIREQQELGRLSREIHDGFAQLLFGSDLQLEHVRKSLEEEGSPHAAALAGVSELIRQAVAQARDLSRGLSPVPTGAALFEVLRMAAHAAEQRLGVRCTFVGGGHDMSLGQLATTHLYRIVQEAITNAVRHGGSTAIEISCKIDNEHFLLSIEDNGSGLPDPIVENGGIGLKNMRYRARAIGCDLKIGNLQAGDGAQVTCACPIAAISD